MAARVKLPVSPVVMPACLAGHRNGLLPRSLLVRTDAPELLMVAPAARAFNALRAACEAETGFVLRSVGGYRTLHTQWWAFGGKGARYEPCSRVEWLLTPPSRRKEWPDAARDAVAAALGIEIPAARWWRKINVGTLLKPRYRATAAVPETSNHGCGLALDVRSIPQRVVAWLCANAARFGFSAEIQSESWHWRYFAGDDIPDAVIEYEEGDVSKLVTIEGDSEPWLATGTVLQRCSRHAADVWRFLGVKSAGQLSRPFLKNYPCPAGDLGPFTPADFDQPTQDA